MDYATLRSEGIGHLERLAGESWTDYNVHDPGITILEQLAYVLSDLGYRIGYDMPDLLAEGDRSPYQSLHQAADILTTHPVTTTDLRKLVLDVDGVKNAWVEPADGASLALHYHPGREELSLEAEPPASEPVSLTGLHRVFVEAVEGESAAGLRARVAERLFSNRPLCEDFVEIRVLDPQPIQVDATIELAPVEDAESVLLDILSALADEISPWIPLVSLEKLADGGESVDEIFDGPRLEMGSVGYGEIPGHNRRTSLRTSDLVHAVMGVPGVRAITRISVAAGGPPDPWSVDLDLSKAPILDLRRRGISDDAQLEGRRVGSSVVLQSGGLTSTTTIVDVGADHNARQLAKRQENRRGRSGAEGIGSAFAVPPARDRAVGSYYSMQHHLPALFGLAEMGLPDSASPARKAQAKQLKAYLLMFDQIMANGFTQLAHTSDLFSFYGESRRTYFAEPIEDSRLGLEGLRGDGHEEHLSRIVEPLEEGDRARGTPSSRKNRFLNHLLARFAEQFSSYSFVVSGAAPDGAQTPATQLLQDKQMFLQHYPRISSARGTAADDLSAPGPDNVSGLAERLRLKLGLSAENGEDFVLVEHLSLRPIEADRQQALPILTASPHRDPYSLQLSFVFVGTEGRLALPGFRDFVEHTVREETPAHLTPYVHWLQRGEWDAFALAHADWLSQRRDYLVERFGLPESEGA